jgi:hypothetical protein
VTSLDLTLYHERLEHHRLQLGVVFDEGDHPRDGKGRFRTLTGTHGVSKSADTKGAFKSPTLYIADDGLAQDYADGGDGSAGTTYRARADA